MIQKSNFDKIASAILLYVIPVIIRSSFSDTVGSFVGVHSPPDIGWLVWTADSRELVSELLES